MTALCWPPKDPDEILDYMVDWSARLDADADTITAVTWIVPAGITKTTEYRNDTQTQIWLSGGTAGETYEFTCRITTARGRVMDQTVTLDIKDR